jgi:hypothetical protein
MRRSIKTAVLWLLLAIMPVQGVAFAAMMVCGPDHHAAGNKTDAGHDHTGATHQHQKSPAGTLADNTHHHDGQGQTKCAACMPCCGAASMVTPTLMLSMSLPGDNHPVSFNSASFPHYSSDGPDRPPRIVLA